MAAQTHEQTINIALGEVLEDLGHNWDVHAEEIGGIFEGGGRPDILLEKPGAWPIVMEAEVDNHAQAEKEARERLGKRLIDSTHTVNTAFAIVYPDQLREVSGAALRDALRDATLEYALFSIGIDEEVQRLPTTGWLAGDVTELALLLHRASIPAWQVESLADTLETGVKRAEGGLTEAHAIGSAIGEKLADVLDQSDDEAGQTRRMAMTVIANALVFHAALAEAEMLVEDDDEQRPVKSPREFRSNGVFLPTPLTDEWRRILVVNYWPIFHTAGALLDQLPTKTAAVVVGELWSTAEGLIAGGVTRSHDLTGIVFQRLIADRKFLATYYTRPAGAALLSGLAMPIEEPLGADKWADGDALAQIRIGDFACGTGTLLSTAYQRLSLLHEVHEGQPREMHPVMMKQGLVGLDVLNVAVHLTAAMLAGTHPDTPFEGECLLTMPYGEHDWGVSVGSLELLEEQPMFEMMQAAAHTAGGRGEEQVRNLLERVGHGHFDLVIMNPPFTRHGAREGDRTMVHNPAFAAFEATEEEQNRLSAHVRHLDRNGCGHGHAGLASYFVDLAHRKTASGGTVALVLPLSSMSGTSWEKTRDRWRVDYSSLLVTTISERGTHSRSFSADTGMAECLVIARKESPEDGQARANFVVLNSQPQATLEGELIAQAITAEVEAGHVRTLEGGPFGGTRIALGDTTVGEILNCPLPFDGPWQMVGVTDMSLGQTAHQLGQGKLWIQQMPEEKAQDIPIAKVADVSDRIGPHHLDLTGARIKSDGLPQGPFEKVAGYSPGDAYPALWNHDSKRERTLLVEPDHHCQIREVDGGTPQRLRDRAETRWETATRAHYNVDFQFNSQSLVVAMTESLAIGGTAWPSVILEHRDHEYAFSLWCNSTLGFLCHWWMANKTQAGRGRTTVTGIPLIPTLDLRVLTAEQHAAAKEAFEALEDQRFLPFDQINEDEARAELDRRLLVNVLNLDPGLCEDGGPMELLREKLAAEPQIHGNKQTRVVFTPEGETTEARSDD
ncbi:MAG: hypothetical protein ACN0LA_03275 [Candidatus Longimicrobiales bacterium M2_2A_002]